MTTIEKVYPFPEAKALPMDGVPSEAAEESRELENRLGNTQIRIVPLLQGEVKIVSVEDEDEVTIAEMLAQHPQPELLINKFIEAVEVFRKYEEKDKLATAYSSPEGPTIGLTNKSAAMVRLHEVGFIDPNRYEEGRANLAETAFVKLYIDQRSNPSLTGETEKLTMQILNMQAEQHTKERNKQK